MNTWKRFSIFVMSLFLVAMLAACGGASSSGTTATSGQGNQATASTPTVDVSTPTPVPTSAPSTGGCTSAASCQKAVVEVSPKQARRGEKVKVTVKDWVANAKAHVNAGIQINDSDTVSVTSDAQGNFSVTLTIRPDTPDFGPTDILVTLDNSTDDGARDLKVPDKLTIVK